jgi:cyclopropane fatty-acyl-phospholipid synthase-like methyltransferase
MAEPTSNAPQTEYWTGLGGQNWVADDASYDAMLAPVAEAVLDALDPRPGERILDIGAGTGTLSLAVAERVRPKGHVTAVDVSPTMLGRAAERIAAEEAGDTPSPVGSA